MNRLMIVQGLFCLTGIGVGAASMAAIEPGVAASPSFYTPEQLKGVELMGVRVGMPLRDATEMLRRRGMLPSASNEVYYPDNKTAGALRFSSKDELPLLDVTFHHLRGAMIVTGLGLQEAHDLLNSGEKDRLLARRYGPPTSVERTRYGAQYQWSDRGWEEKLSDPDGTACVGVFSFCLPPGVPHNCPAKLVRRGVVMTAGFPDNKRLSSSRLYVNINDTASQYLAVYRGRRELPPRPTCPPPAI